MNELFDTPVLITVITSPVLALRLLQAVLWAYHRRRSRMVLRMAFDVMFEVDKKLNAIDCLTVTWSHVDETEIAK